ncbi:MAG: hypothetical protein GC154_14020 [bacterium]|nr:hypothetical protein [bacterium]
MSERSDLKLIDLLSLKPGALLQMHSVRGQAECAQRERITTREAWRSEVSNAVIPAGTARNKENLSQLLDVPIAAQVIVRHGDGKVLEILRLTANNWDALLKREGHQVDLMVDGRILASGQVVNNEDECGVRIERLAGNPD